MNIFILSTNPKEAAQFQCDKHVVKMCLETVQILCNALENPPYKKTHSKHPCVLWALASRENYLWLLQHGHALLNEYTFRYGKIHKSRGVYDKCLDEFMFDKIKFDNYHQTPFALAMPDECKVKGAVESYRKYYLEKKAHFAKWTKREVPYWWKHE